MKKTMSVLLMAGILGVLAMACASEKAPAKYGKPDLSPLSTKEKAEYERIAREWMNRLWTNDYSGCVPVIYVDQPYKAPPWQYPMVNAEFEKSPGDYCWVSFFNRNSRDVCGFINSAYKKVPYNRKYHGVPDAIHSTEEQAKARVNEIAELLGVTNVWDATKYDLRSKYFIEGIWAFFFSKRINGYPTTHPLTVMVADLPGLPLHWWTNATDWEGTDIPTNVVLTSEQAGKKSVEYIKKYLIGSKDMGETTYVTNSLEYVSPNYNYIRPADGVFGSFSDYVSKKPELNLAWKCYFTDPDRTKQRIPPIIIYVDAATGEMLGGTD